MPKPPKPPKTVEDADCQPAPHLLQLFLLHSVHNIRHVLHQGARKHSRGRRMKNAACSAFSCFNTASMSQSANSCLADTGRSTTLIAALPERLSHLNLWVKETVPKYLYQADEVSMCSSGTSSTAAAVQHGPDAPIREATRPKRVSGNRVIPRFDIRRPFLRLPARGRLESFLSLTREQIGSSPY